MNSTWLIIAILFIIVEGVNVILIKAFITSRNGQLRRLMILYFAIEFYVIALYNGTALYLHAKYGINVLWCLAAGMIPKGIVKMMIFSYLNNSHK